MSLWLHPGLLLMLAGLILPALPSWRLRQALVLIAPVLALLLAWQLPAEGQLTTVWMGLDLTPMKMDALARPFVLIFCLAGALCGLFMLHLRTRLEPAAMLIYAGAAVAAVLAGDLLSLFVYWEATALASALIILANGAGTLRIVQHYLLVQISSGLLLLAGAVVQLDERGQLGFVALEPNGLAGALILLAFGIKAAFPLLHNWLHHAYPAASATGAVVLSVFTTKLAIYALARGYAGSEILIPVGAVMALGAAILGNFEDDLRRRVTYALQTQLGLMTAAIGIGSELAINAAVAHAVIGVLYIALLLMGLGVVLHQHGRISARACGGLSRGMPLTTALSLIACASLVALPLTAGYVSKSPLFSAAEHGSTPWLYALFMLASLGVLWHSGLALPAQTFFGPRKLADAAAAIPLNMHLAMLMTGVLVMAPAAAPALLYAAMPYPMDYTLYKPAALIQQLLSIGIPALIFILLWRARRVPLPRPGGTPDSDKLGAWLWRRLAPPLSAAAQALTQHTGAALQQLGSRTLNRIQGAFDEQALTRVWPLASGGLLLMILLGAWLLQLL